MMRYRNQFASFILVLADLVGFVGVGTLSYGLRVSSSSTLYTHFLSIGDLYLLLLFVLLLTRGYRFPRRWGANEAVPAAMKALLITSPFAWVWAILARRASLDGGLLLFLAVGLLLMLIAVRLLIGWFQIALFRRGIALMQTVVLGGEAEFAKISERIASNMWLGLHVIGYVEYGDSEAPRESQGELEDLLERNNVHAIWLAPGWNDAGPPPILFDSRGSKVSWYVLQEHFEQISTAGLRGLGEQLRSRFYSRVKYRLSLPQLRVAMLGSRGVPANYGGIERHIEELGSRLSEEQIEVAVYCHARYVPEMKEYRGMELRRLPSISTRHLETITHTIVSTLHILISTEPIVHYHAMGPSTLAWIPRLFGRKVVVTVHGIDWRRAKWGFLARLFLRLGEWTAFCFPHRTIVVSQSLVEHYGNRFCNQPLYIPNGTSKPTLRTAEIIQRSGLSKNGYILFVGRLVSEKGCHILLDAFSQTRTDKKLVIAAHLDHTDPYTQRLRGMANSRVNFLGFVEGAKLEELFSNAYIVVNASELEGRSVSLLEALSYENCLLVSDIPENLEVVGDAAYRFQTGNSQDLAEKMQWLLDNPDAVEAMRTRIRAHFDSQLTWQDTAQMTRGLYTSLLDGRK